MPTITGLTPTGCAQLFESLASYEGGVKLRAVSLLDHKTVELAAKAMARLAEELKAARLEPGGGGERTKPATPVTEIRSAAELEQALADAKSAGKAVVLDFFAPWCKPCVRAMPRYTELARSHGDRASWLKLNIDVVGDKVKDEWAVKKIPKFMVWKEGKRLGSCGTGYDDHFNSSLMLEAFIDHVLLGGPDPRKTALGSPKKLITNYFVSTVRSADGLSTHLKQADSDKQLVFIAMSRGVGGIPASFWSTAGKNQAIAKFLHVDLQESGPELAAKWGVDYKAAEIKYVAWKDGKTLGDCGKSSEFSLDLPVADFVASMLARSVEQAEPPVDVFDFDGDF